MTYLPSLLALCSLCLLTRGNAQQSAITQTGDEVLLFEDGTWTYKDTSVSVASSISVNPQPFEKPEQASFLLKSAAGGIGVWLNPKEWTFKKASDNPSAEYEFRLKAADLYGMLIAEGIEIPLDNLREIAIANARAAAPDLTVTDQEYRTVNGLDVLMMRMSGTMRGVKFAYLGYYYSDDSGSYQFLTYTSQKLIEQHLPACEALLNGIVALP